MLHLQASSDPDLESRTAVLILVVLRHLHVGHTAIATCVNGTLVSVFDFGRDSEELDSLDLCKSDIQH